MLITFRAFMPLIIATSVPRFLQYKVADLTLDIDFSNLLKRGI
jgi:hypothetical protein